MFRTKSSAAVAVAALLGTTRAAHAETGAAVAVHVVVDAPASCTDGDRFWSEVNARTTDLLRVESRDDTPLVMVRAWQDGEEAHGQLSLRTARGERLPTREVAGRTCEEVTAALALALALAGGAFVVGDGLAGDAVG